MSLKMHKNSNQQSLAPSVQFFQIARSFAIRYLACLREKSSQPQAMDELQITISRMLNPNESKQVVLSKLLSLQLRGDYHQVIALTLLQDLAKWSRENYPHIISNLQYKPLLQSIIQHSIKLLNSQQQFHTIVPKQNDLLRQLLITPYIVTNNSLEGFRTFYRKLKDVKEFYPQTVKEHQKIVFLKTVEETVEVCAKFQAIRTFQFIFHNIFAELEVLESSHEFVTSRLKLVKKIVKNLWFFHQDILYKSAFVVMKFSQQVLTLPHLFSSVLNLYQDLMPVLIQKVSPGPLIIFNHLIINNIQKLLQQKSPSTLSLQILLSTLTQIFKPPFIEYFMKAYDANFMQESVCQSALNILFEFVENRANEKKPEYDIFKRYLKKATDCIRRFLNKQEPHIKQPSQKLQKFYEVKRKQYLEIVQDMNEKPKKLFKKLQSISNKEIKQEIMKKYSRIAKHSTHLGMKKMIDLFASNNSTSQEMFAEYVNLLFSNLSKDVNLEEFLRFFSSNFFLSGQSQQILRVLDKITVLFYNHQPLNNRILKNSDSTYTFANAIILLNADLHNPQNEQKMSLESFYKICKKINAGDDLPTQMLTQTYTNIKKNKINTFRNKSQMLGISPSNFVLICNKQEENRIDFFDLEMKMLNDENFYDFWVFDLLSGIIDERQTMKLQQLIERFMYDDNSYECEVIELVRKLAKKKPHIPLHALEKILEHANFKNTRTSQKTISYLWLAVNLIQTFPSYLPTNVICQLLIFTWRMRLQIKDDMYLRERAQIKRIRKMVREYQKRQSKKSIMDIFSSFLSSKQEDSQPDVIEEFNMSQTNIKKMNYKILTEKVLQVLIKSSSGSNSSRPNHRVKAIEFFVGYLRNDQQKIFEEFLSLLYMIFHLLYRFEINPRVLLKQHSEGGSGQSFEQNMQQTSPKKISNLMSSSLNLSTELKQSEDLSLTQFQETIEDLLYELLGLKQSSITKRIENLKKKDVKKYEVLESYCHYWVLKILINKIQLKGKVDLEQLQRNGSSSKVENKENNQNQRKQNNLLYLLNKSIQYLQKTDKQIYLDLVYEFEEKAKQAFSVSFRSNVNYVKEIKENNNQGQNKQEKVEQTEKKANGTSEKKEEFIQTRSEEVILMKENWQQVGMTKDLSLKQQSGHQQQAKQIISHQSNEQPTSQQNPNPINQQRNLVSLQPPTINPQFDEQNSSSSNSPTFQQQKPQQNDENQQEIIETFIFNYRKLILEFYVNCMRVVGKEEMKKKQWRWLVQLEKMIQQVIENYEEKVIKKKKYMESIKEKQPKSIEEKKESPLKLASTSQPHDINNQEPQENQKNKQSNKTNHNQQQQIQNQPLKQKLQQQTDKQQQDLMERINKQLPQNHQQNQVQNDTAQKVELPRENINETKLQIQPQVSQHKFQYNNEHTQPAQSQSFVNQSSQNVTKEQLSQPTPINVPLSSNQNDQNHQKDKKNSQKIDKQTNLIKEEQQAIKKLMEMYPAGCQSSEILGMPFYML